MENQNKPKRKRYPKEYYVRVKGEFVDFLANPEEERLQGDFAKEKDVGEDTLSGWKSEDGFWDNVWERFTSFYLQGQLPAINKKLVQKAKTGDKDAMDKVYKLAGRMPPEKVEHTFEEPLTEEQMEALKSYNERFEEIIRGKSSPDNKECGKN